MAPCVSGCVYTLVTAFAGMTWDGAVAAFKSIPGWLKDIEQARLM